MKLVKEAYKLLSSDSFKSILLIIQMAGFIILFNISLGTVNTADFLSGKVENTALKNAYYYSYGQGGLQDNSSNSDLNSITFFDYFTPIYNNEQIIAERYTKDFLNENPLKLKNGAKIKTLEKNECVVSYGFAQAMRLKKGDKIQLSYNNKAFDLVVKGILHRDEQIIKFTTSGSNLTLKFIYEKPLNTVIFTACDNITEEDMKVYPCGIFNNTNNLTNAEIENTYKKYGEITSFKSMLAEEQEENKSIIMLFTSFAIVLFFITFINVTANNFLILKFQEKRFGIYFFCGMSYGEIFKIISLRNGLLIGISCILSLGVISYIWKFSYIDEFSFNITTLLSSLIIVAILTMISEIPMYLKMKNTEPIRFFEEGLE